MMRDMEWTRSIVSSALDGLEVIEARFESHTFPLHAHDEYVIGSVVDGAKGSRHGSRDLVADAGSLMLFNPHEEHTSAGFGAAWRFIVVYPTAAHLEKWFGASTKGGKAPRFSDPLVKDEIGERLITGFLAAQSRPHGALEIQSAFVALMSHLMSRHMSSGHASTPMPSLHRARELLDASLSDDVTLSELAASEQVSPAALMRAFRSAYGCTPRVYLTARRIAQAKRSLKAGGSLADIAATLCFCDQSHLTRVFKRWTGMTPGAFSRM